MANHTDEILHHTVTPVGRTRVRISLGTTAPSDLGQCGLDEGSRVRDEKAGFAHLGHGGGDEVALNQLNGDSMRFELGAESRGPVLEEGFAAGVGC